MCKTERRISRARRGFTAIELLVASALAGMLMVSVLGVIGSLTAHRRVLLDRKAPRPWAARLLEQLRWDLANGRRLWWRPDTLRIEGYASRDLKSHALLHRPSKVVYSVRTINDQSWLFRQEIHPNNRSNDNHRTELVCSDVSEMQLQIDADQMLPQEEVLAVPRRVKLVLKGTDPNRHLLDEVVFPR